MSLPLARSHPLFNDNKLKLGLFSINCSYGCAISTAPDFDRAWPRFPCGLRRAG
jgi:hypothetical protein